MEDSRGERASAAARRVSGVAILLLLPLLALQVFLLSWGDPTLYDSVAGFWRTGPGRATTLALLAALAFHAADGLRASAVEVWPARRRALLPASWALFAALLGVAVWTTYGGVP